MSNKVFNKGTLGTMLLSEVACDKSIFIFEFDFTQVANKYSPAKKYLQIKTGKA